MSSSAEAATMLAEQLLRIASGFGDLRCYLLMQPSDRREESDEAFEMAVQAAGRRPFPVVIGQLPESLRPYLIELDLHLGGDSLVSGEALAMALRDRSHDALRQGCIQRSCAWLFSPRDVASLAKAIARRSVAAVPGVPGLQWMRYYDPMVTDLYWALSSDATQAAMLDGIAAWVYVDRRTGLETLVAPTATTAEARAPHPALHGIGALNQAWIRSMGEGAMPAREELLRAMKAIDHAWTAGIRDRIDLDAFAWDVLSRGSGIIAHPVMMRLLQRAKEGEAYADLADQLDDAAWHRIEVESKGASAPRSQERATP